MKNAKFIIIPLIIMLAGCNIQQTDSSTSFDTTSDTTTMKTYTKMPNVGEVRQWFDEGTIGETQIYNYCPSTFVENGVKHTYYCTNKIEGNVTDYVGYRSATFDETKGWEFSEKQYILEPTPDTWDARHTCDPSVIKGEFHYDGEQYNYLMAFLGCVTSDNSLNETGIAVSKTPEGPWIKCNKINPLVPGTDQSKYQWGTGQADLISVDEKGRVLLFVTNGTVNGSYTDVYEYDLSDCNNPILIRQKKISTNGLIADGGALYIVNATFTYDIENKKIIMCKPRNPYGTDQREPSFIASKLDVYWMDDSSNENLGDELFKGNAGKSWHIMGTIDENLTGFPRNHNNGIVKDPYGRTLDPKLVEVAFTRSDLAFSGWGYWSTYRIYSTSFELKYE